MPFHASFNFPLPRTFVLSLYGELLFFLYLPSTYQEPTFSNKFEDFVNEISVRSFLPFTDCFFLSGVVSFRFHAPRDSPESKAIIVSQPHNKEVGTRFNINFESCNFSESNNIKCGSSDSSRGFSQLIKVHECQYTITSHHGTCHPSKSELSEAEPILSRDSNH